MTLLSKDTKRNINFVTICSSFCQNIAMNISNNHKNKIIVSPIVDIMYFNNIEPFLIHV